jgi:ribosomal protein S18 acetylase RimI-like enzyme
VSTLDTHVDVGLTWRPITEADLPAWHELVAAIEAADDPAERNTLDDLRDYLLDGSWKDPAADSLIGLDDDGVPRAFGHVEVRPGDVRSVRAFCWGGVHPRWRRRGIGRAVLAWQEATARRKVEAAAKPVPARAQVTTEERLTGCTTLLEGAGFRPVRWYIDMSRRLEGTPVPDVPLDDGLRLVPFDESLDERVRLAHNESFAEHWGSEPRTVEDWQRWTTGHRNFRADWSFVVLDGDEVAGYTLASAYEQDWAAQGYTSGWTDLLGVRPAWRGRRLAPALLAASMRAFAGSGMDRADIGVDSENASGALQLYTRLGYVEQRRGVMYAKDLG